jgi:hypothetical protein
MLISMPTGTSTIFGVFQAILDLHDFGTTPNDDGSYFRRRDRASVRCNIDR